MVTYTYGNATGTYVLSDDGQYIPVDTRNSDYLHLLDSGAEIALFVPVPQPIIFTPRAFIETLFTPAEQQAIYTAAQTPAGWQIAMFISLIAASPEISLSDPELIKDIGVVQAAGILTAPRAAQILAGTLPT